MNVYRQFIAAIRRGKIEKVQQLLDDGVDPANRNNEPIRIAAWNGQSDIVALLLTDERVSPEANNNEAINDAANEGHIDTVALLFQDPRVRDAGLPFPDPKSEDPLASILGEILMTPKRAISKITHKHGFARNPSLAEYRLLSHIFEYHPVAYKKKR